MKYNAKAVDFIVKNANIDTETFTELLSEHYKDGYSAGVYNTIIDFIGIFAAVEGALWLKERYERRKNDKSDI